MEVGGDRYRAVGGIHRIPIDDVPGRLLLAGLDVVGPDPAGALDHVGAAVVVCLQTDAELDRRHPTYRPWLADPTPHEAIRLPIEDHLVTVDGATVELVHTVADRLDRADGVLVHCGAGWGRAGLLGALVLTGYGATVDDALTRIRAARPAAGPQSPEQHDQLARLAPRITRRSA